MYMMFLISALLWFYQTAARVALSLKQWINDP